MSRLDEQLKELQTKKLKAEFLKLLKNKVGDVTNDKFKSVEKEIKDQVFAFLDARVDMIESGEIKQESELKGLFSSDEVEVLKLLAQRAASKQNKVSQPKEIKENPYKTTGVEAAPEITAELTPAEKIKFAQELRHLDAKEIKMKDGSSGTVVGLDAPHVIVQLYNGVSVRVKPEDVIV